MPKSEYHFSDKHPAQLLGIDHVHAFLIDSIKNAS